MTEHMQSEPEQHQQTPRKFNREKKQEEEKTQSYAVTSTIVESDPNMFFKINADAIARMIPKQQGATPQDETGAKIKTCASRILADALIVAHKEGARHPDKEGLIQWMEQTEGQIAQVIQSGKPVSLFAIKSSMLNAGWNMPIQLGQGIQKEYVAAKSKLIPGELVALEKDMSKPNGKYKPLGADLTSQLKHPTLWESLSERERLLASFEKRTENKWPGLPGNNTREPIADKLGAGVPDIKTTIKQ